MLIRLRCHVGVLETTQFCVTIGLAASYNCAVDACLVGDGGDSADCRQLQKKGASSVSFRSSHKTN